MAEDRSIKTICDEILFRVGELAGLAIKADIEDTNRKIEEQIEKMKCCGNCKHYVDYNCDLQCPHNCYNYDEWELKA